MNVGDLVRLKSGGPLMVIEWMAQDGSKCNCTWFGRHYESAGFDGDSGWLSACSVGFDPRTLVLEARDAS